MIYLLLAIASSALVSTVMRFSEKYVKNNMGMFMANYAVCLVLARVYMGQAQLFTTESGIGFAVGLGLFSGVLYLAGFVLLQKNMIKNGMALASTFMKLGVLVPTLMAILIYGERPSAVQILGILLSITAIILINFEKNNGEGKGSAGWMLIVLLLVSGISDAMANVYEKNGKVLFKEHYLFYTFLAALICAVIFNIKSRENVRWMDLAFGVLIGIPNYFSARFLLLALGSVPAVITYPVCNVATIVVISIISVIIFKEKMSRKKMTALGMILVAMVLLNI